MANETNEIDGTDTAPAYPLARDVNGIPFVVPVAALAWRVRKLAKRAGRPKLIIDAETGAPLELPLTATYDDLCDQVSDAGRYRLEAVDGGGRPIAGCVAVTELFTDGDDASGAPTGLPTDALPAALQLIAQLVQSNAKVMEAMASAFGQVQPSAAPAPVIVAAPTAPQSEKTQPNFMEMFQQAMQAASMFRANVAAATATTPSDGNRA